MEDHGDRTRVDPDVAAARPRCWAKLDVKQTEHVVGCALDISSPSGHTSRRDLDCSGNAAYIARMHD